MKPRSFGQVFGETALLIGAVGFVLHLCLRDRMSHQETNALVFAIFVTAIFGSLKAAQHLQGEILARECDDPKKAFSILAARLVENGYSVETQTETLHAFKPPFQYWLGGRVYVFTEGPTLRIIGPSYLIKKLRDA